MPAARLLHTTATDAGGHALISLLTGDVRAVLPTLASNSVQCVITSPPYYALRSYLDAAHPDKQREIGSEPTPDAYIATMVEVFREVRRVLRDDGTCWVNMGDSYAHSGGENGHQYVDGGKRKLAEASGLSEKPSWGRAKPKDLLMMPARLALALQADGWWLRSDIIWSKPNPMPESCRDRPTSAHEHVFLLTKRSRYYYDADAVREPHTEGTHSRGGEKTNGRDALIKSGHWNTLPPTENPTGRNLRNVWSIATHAFPAAHFATFAPELAERCIRAGTSERGACPACGAPWVRVTERTGGTYQERKANGVGGPYNFKPEEYQTCGGSQSVTTGWSPSCTCNADVRPCVVLDPFSGAGTALLVADRLGRDSIGIDLNADYVSLAKARVEMDAGLFANVVEDRPVNGRSPATPPSRDTGGITLLDWIERETVNSATEQCDAR